MANLLCPPQTAWLPQFEYFCTTSPAHDAVAEHKAVLRGKYEEARALGARVAASKQRIGELKAAVERRRLARSMAALLRQQAGGGNGGGEQVEEGELQDAEEESAKGLIEKARPLAGAAACASAVCLSALFRCYYLSALFHPVPSWLFG